VPTYHVCSKRYYIDEVVAAQKEAGVEQIVINVFVGKHVAVTYPHSVCNMM
jgi:hypothetical protein